MMMMMMMMMMMITPIPFSTASLHLHLLLLVLFTSTLLSHTNASPTATTIQNQNQVQDPDYPFGPLDVIIQFTRPGEPSFADINSHGTSREEFLNRDDIAILSLEPTLDFEYADADAINADPVPISYSVGLNDYSRSPVAMSVVKIVYGRADVRCTVEAAGGAGGDQASWELRAGKGPVELAGSADTDVARIVCLAGETDMYSEI